MGTVIRSAEMSLLETPGGNFSGAVATAGHGASEVSIVMQQQNPGGQNPRHTHDREEVMVVRQGQVRVLLADTPIALSAGDSLIVSANTPHQIQNIGDEQAEWLLVAPAGIRFFGADGTEMHPAWLR